MRIDGAEFRKLKQRPGHLVSASSRYLCTTHCRAECSRLHKSAASQLQLQVAPARHSSDPDTVSD
jgi:hypothetical protein